MKTKKSHEQMITEWHNDPAFKAEYDALENDFALFDELIKARQSAGLTQEAVAKRMGTKVPAISRIETGRHSPTVATLRRYATACGKRLEIKIVS